MEGSPLSAVYLLPSASGSLSAGSLAAPGSPAELAGRPGSSEDMTPQTETEPNRSVQADRQTDKEMTERPKAD